MGGRGPVVVLGCVLADQRATMGETGAYQVIEQLRVGIKLVHEASEAHRAVPSQDGERVVLRLEGAL